MDFFNNIKNGLQTAGNWLKNNIIDSAPYQDVVKPIVRGFVDSTVKPIVGKYTGPLSGLANQGIDAIGKASNAYGLRPHKKRSTKRMHHARKHAEHHGDQEYFKILAPSPIMPHPVNAPEKGGAFLASGYGYRRK